MQHRHVTLLAIALGHSDQGDSRNFAGNRHINTDKPGLTIRPEVPDPATKCCSRGLLLKERYLTSLVKRVTTDLLAG
jgi:hypothetical protein